MDASCCTGTSILVIEFPRTMMLTAAYFSYIRVSYIRFYIVPTVTSALRSLSSCFSIRHGSVGTRKKYHLVPGCNCSPWMEGPCDWTLSNHMFNPGIHSNQRVICSLYCLNHRYCLNLSRGRQDSYRVFVPGLPMCSLSTFTRSCIHDFFYVSIASKFTHPFFGNFVVPVSLPVPKLLYNESLFSSISTFHVYYSLWIVFRTLRI